MKIVLKSQSIIHIFFHFSHFIHIVIIHFSCFIFKSQIVFSLNLLLNILYPLLKFISFFILMFNFLHEDILVQLVHCFTSVEVLLLVLFLQESHFFIGVNIFLPCFFYCYDGFDFLCTLNFNSFYSIFHIHFQQFLILFGFLLVLYNITRNFFNFLLDKFISKSLRLIQSSCDFLSFQKEVYFGFINSEIAQMIVTSYHNTIFSY